MADHPMLFSPAMVRALLDGRKTQTRRLLRVPPPFDVTDDLTVELAVDNIAPQYAPGDLLWVREAFRGSRGYDGIPPSQWGNKPIWYTADGNPDKALWWHLSDQKKPGIHMPRRASRLTLTITDVRVQRVQEISPEDAIREGYPFDAPPAKGRETYLEWYRDLWDSLNATRAPWDSNPWVVALTFSVEQRNIDAIEHTAQAASSEAR